MKNKLTEAKEKKRERRRTNTQNKVKERITNQRKLNGIEVRREKWSRNKKMEW